MREFETRKRALVAESEIYRKALTLEVQNLRLYGAGWRKHTAILSSLAPIAALLTPVVTAAFGRKRAGKLGMLGMIFRGWRLYRKYGPTLINLTAPYFARRREAPESKEPADDTPTGRQS